MTGTPWLTTTTQAIRRRIYVNGVEHTAGTQSVYVTVTDAGVTKWLTPTNTLTATQTANHTQTYSATEGWLSFFTVPDILLQHNVSVTPINSILGPAYARPEEHYVTETDDDGFSQPGGDVAA